ncbi:velvet factor-domain-containing protein [Cokeromyces recurvatus]|uniref:velvet factor-domain-containing protein n=1 Tax=Cokeromyces recurvatus TaxID=90255 RepID=UPI0022209065|nr:velvet factor-domain-containing protein [Cokeromyces recurvatus]KAI7905477.1 velvet factor-domain-containing protein [Cokeromyces recurvatus]
MDNSHNKYPLNLTHQEQRIFSEEQVQKDEPQHSDQQQNNNISDLLDFFTTLDSTNADQSFIFPSDKIITDPFFKNKNIIDSLLHTEQIKGDSSFFDATAMAQLMMNTHNHTVLQPQNPAILFDDNMNSIFYINENTTDKNIDGYNDANMTDIINADQYLLHGQTSHLNFHQDTSDDIRISCNPSHNNPEQLQQQSRGEQDVFDELISLATSSNEKDETLQTINSTWQHYNQSYPSFKNNSNIRSMETLDKSIKTEKGKESELTKKYYMPPKPSTNVNINDLSKNEIKLFTTTSSTVIKNNYLMENNDRIYELDIVQQPLRARMCGNGAKDRRPITPPPILKLTVRKESGEITSPETIDVSFLIVMCDFCQKSGPNINETSNSKKQSSNGFSQVVYFPLSTFDSGSKENYNTFRLRSLAGSLVSSAIKLYDTDGELGIYFIFQDISLRTEGTFRLKFSLIDIGLPYIRTVNTSTVSHVLKVVESELFTVYTAKKFPGVVQSTSLSKCFARQGVKMPIHKENTHSIKKRSTSSNGNENNEAVVLEEEVLRE